MAQELAPAPELARRPSSYKIATSHTRDALGEPVSRLWRGEEPSSERMLAALPLAQRPSLAHGAVPVPRVALPCARRRGRRASASQPSTDALRVAPLPDDTSSSKAVTDDDLVYFNRFAQVMEDAAEHIVRIAEQPGSDERSLDSSRARMYELERELRAGGDSAGAAFAEHLLALLRHRFLASATQLPEELRAGVLQYAGLLLSLQWQLEGLPEEVAQRLREAATEAMGGDGEQTEALKVPGQLSEAERRQLAELEASSMAAVRKAQSAGRKRWQAPAVGESSLDPSDVAERVESALQRLAAQMAQTEGERETVQRFAQLLSFSVKGVSALHAGDPRCRSSMTFVLQFAADTLGRLKDVGGAQLLVCLEAALGGTRLTAVDQLPGDLAACFSACQQRCAARGWQLRREGAEAEVLAGSAAAPPADPELALKDAFAYALLAFWSRLQWCEARAAGT